MNTERRDTGQAMIAEAEKRLDVVASAFPQQRRTFPVSQFLAGVQCITSAKHGAILAHMGRTDPHDAEEIQRWYEPDTSKQPTYADDPRWKDWWIEVLKNPQVGLEGWKLVLREPPNQPPQTLGFLAVKNVSDWHAQGAPTLYLNGIRINPQLMPREKQKRSYRGVGTALITHAVILSLERGLEGIGVNSSLGVEGFYERLGMKATPAHDGKRKYMMLKGREERARFLCDRYHESLIELSRAS